MLVVLESVRADVVGLHVNGRPVTPTLDALARAVGAKHLKISTDAELVPQMAAAAGAVTRQP